MKISYAVYTTAGKIRRQNQDNFFLDGLTKPAQENCIWHQGESDKIEQIFAIYDGMGGQDAGELAASLAAETMKAAPPSRFPEWEPYITQANERICRFQEKHNLRMGTTFAGLRIYGNQTWVANVGDSRIYRIRHQTIEQLTRDHTEFQIMVDAGIFRKEDFSKNTAHNHLTQHLGIRAEEMLLNPYMRGPEVIEDGDVYLLCSDGLYGVIDQEDLLHMIIESESDLECTKQLIICAEGQGSRDNITVLLIRISNEKVNGKLLLKGNKQQPWWKRILAFLK